jgi:hypothetical protein
MSNYNKSIKHWRTYETRKDWYHTRQGKLLSFYRKKKIRHQANIKLRRYKGEVANNSWYKRFSEVAWIIL